MVKGAAPAVSTGPGIYSATYSGVSHLNYSSMPQFSWFLFGPIWCARVLFGEGKNKKKERQCHGSAAMTGTGLRFRTPFMGAMIILGTTAKKLR
jgi:hypothetical protein